MGSAKQWIKMFTPLLVLAGAAAYVAYRTRRVPAPRSRWRRYFEPDTEPLDVHACNNLQGLYTIENGKELFGNDAVVKWSYTVERKKTQYHLSFFCEKNGTYLICEGKRQGNDILLNGYWRKAAANGTGLVRLVLHNGYEALRNGSKAFSLSGWYGYGGTTPMKPLSFRFHDALPHVPPLDIIAHRGGARNVDFLAVSENTVEMTRRAARLGATGIEIDVRTTKDGVPVIFHDSFFSIHTIQDKLYGGLLHDHTLAEVKQLTLRKGGTIPTLEEMLYTVLHETPLEVVWLDIKKECDMEVIRNIQRVFHQKAAAIGRTLHIYIGIPDTYVLRCFQQLSDYEKVPSLTELDCKTALSIDAEVWAPQYTNGFQSDDVATMHAAGKKAYVWSLDNKLMIDLYMSEG
ncbi:MAG TPA: glycerophosphodiester phosphodiesterase, partial [Flavisolibacter sp.]|nr:glycerophosphodiester phosphodiesterase [Flavisolibacter sp.]